MAGKFRKIWEGIAHYETASAILHSEFVRSWLWPLVSAMLTGGSGVVGGQSLMWVCVASSIVFMTVTMGMVANLVLRERKSPQNKLFVKPVFQCDLTPKEKPLIGNRHQRRSQGSQQPQPQMLSATQLGINVNRTIDVGQIGVELTNNAFFPISCSLYSAETVLEGERPPRSKFPKQGAIIAPGSSLRVLDDRIDMELFPCQKLAGRMELLIKYGLPGNEIYELPVKGAITIVMESWGFVGSILMDPNG
jgi:hypothetical protein